MAYVDTILEPGEKLLYRTRRHWIVFWRPVVVIFVALILWGSLTSEGNSDAHGVGGAILFIGALWFLWIYLYERFEEYAVTNRRVINKYGIIRRDVAFLPLERIQTVDVRQSVLGRLLNYGTVVVHTAATTHGTTARDYISNPEEWRRQVFLATESTILRSASGLRKPASETLDASQSTADRLRELGQLHKDGLISREEYEKKRTELVSKL